MPVDSVAMSNQARLRLRQVHRAASDLRRGVPVVLRSDAPLVILAAETAGADGFAELTAMSGSRPVLILAATRAAAILRAPMSTDAAAVAVALPDSFQNIEIYQALADPLMAQPTIRSTLRAVPAPPDSNAAIGLAKISRLLPAILAVPLPSGSEAVIAGHGLVEAASADVLSYAETEVAGLRQIVSADVPLNGAPDSRVVAFRSHGSAVEHLAIVIGRPESHEAPLVRIHSECFTGDLLGSMRCDCGEQLRGAIRRMAEDGSGVLLYLAQEGRGIGLVNKLRAYGLQDRGLDTMDANRALGWGADERNFLIGATMLRIMGVNRVRLLTNNPDKVDAMAACGIEVAGREPHLFAPNGVNDEYLATKATRFGHMLD
ncbi:MAG: cyclohydrolase [Acetobacteraceae bacterium]|jgi:GTP cyclohydrolase II|nr:ribA [Rhodopila sp.]MDX6502607.1 cyclohydrolase [Blastocatellia bacterium]MEA2733288.1 cyclohydrolase [Acetobacteraceae bacterium]MEA2767918.1 cyclohydrolase [Acetobacteraceae bacterium]